MTTKSAEESEPVSLESSLSAETEAETPVSKEKFPTWIYYYLAFLSLIFTLAILGMINSSRPEEPMLLTLHEVQRKFVPTEIKPVEEEEPATEPQPVVIEPNSKKMEMTKEDPKPVTSLLDDPIYYYPTYSPDDLRKALNKLQTVKSSQVDVVRAEVFSLLGWYENQPKLKADGLTFANRAVKANPQDFRANRDLALASLLLDQMDQARHYHHLINGKLFDSLTKWIAVMISMKTGGGNQAALSQIEQIRKSDLNFFPASYTLIQEYLKQNQLPKARELVEYWREKSQTNPAFVHLVAELLDRQQQYVELIYYLNTFEKVYPKDWEVLFYLAKANQKLQKKDLAKSYYQRILDNQENYTVEQIGMTHFEFGKMQLTDEKPKEAAQSLFQASQRLPSDQNVKFFLASAYFKNEEYEKAIEVYQQMIVTEKYDPKIRIYIGMAYFEASQYRLAEKNLLVSLNQGYRDPLLLYYLAKIEEQRGNLPKTRDYLQQILTVDPNYTLALKMIEKLNSASSATVKQTR